MQCIGKISMIMSLVVACSGSGGSGGGGASIADSFVGSYVGSANVTRRSAIPPSEPSTQREPAYGMRVSSDGRALLFAVDTGCTLRATIEWYPQFFPDQSCMPRELMRNATLTLTQGQVERVEGAGPGDPGALAVTLRFRYQRTDHEDNGTFTWEYTGMRR